MKELTIEQKAQRYDEAIERADELKYVSDKDSLQCKTVEHIFPELSESEDEKIRKELIEYIRKTTCVNFIGKCSKKEAEKYIAWLEKQSKDSPVLSNSSNIGKDEQKPVWSKQDETLLNCCLGAINTTDYFDKDNKNEMSNWLISLKDRVLLQPKQEWSEEDKEIIDYLIDYLESELDSSYTDLDKETFTKEINLLKSLRPQSQWRPSDEQMEALEHFIVYHNGSTNYAKDLEELRLQLKKLKDY